MVAGTVANMAGCFLSKTVSPDRLGTFANPGLGASPSWNVFTLDGGIAFTPSLGVIGDMRLRIDLDALHILSDGLAWAPIELFDQQGDPLEVDSRGRLRRVWHAIEAAGLTVLVGHELEFVVTSATGAAIDRGGWSPYGLGPMLDHEAFHAELLAEAAAAGIPFEQLHAEFVNNQFEFSLPPTNPLAATDALVLARVIVGRVARKHSLRVSFSPFPFAGGGGNGAHIHFSFARDGASLFSGGTGPYGITAEGACALAGVVAGLPGIQAVLGGSILSGARLRPGYFSGAFACWGRENREAAVRFLEATAGNPNGANVEVKIVDPSSNPYLATAAVLGVALDGISSGQSLPLEVSADPAAQTAAQAAASGTVLLPSDLAVVLDALAGSAVAERVLGSEIIEALLAVRRYEVSTFGAIAADELTEKFRFTWSI